MATAEVETRMVLDHNGLPEGTSLVPRGVQKMIEALDDRFEAVVPPSSSIFYTPIKGGWAVSVLVPDEERELTLRLSDMLLHAMGISYWSKGDQRDIDAAADSLLESYLDFDAKGESRRAAQG